MKLRDLFSDDAMIDPQAEAVAVSGLAVDSRAVKPGDLFFALTGHKTDGARFIDSAVSSGADRKSTRLNSSHSQISYAVFCLKNKDIFRQHAAATYPRSVSTEERRQSFHALPSATRGDRLVSHQGIRCESQLRQAHGSEQSSH